MIFLIIIVCYVFIILIGAILHETYYKNKYLQIRPYGELINVEDGQMHVYSMGKGEKTIVLLPGMGVSLPSAEFGPLMRKLSEKYCVVCVEYFGVGFSSQTTKPRTCENYIEETRTVLGKLGVSAPYILMPHSISSVFSEYYAAKYPEEVRAIISLDGTSSAYYAPMPAFVKSLLGVAKFQQAIGFTSVIGSLVTKRNLLLSYGYSEKEINDMVAFAGFSVNSNILQEISSSADYIKEVMNLPFPNNVPYYKVISRMTYEKPNKQIKITPQEYQNQHLARIGEQTKFEILEGNHFIYLNNVMRIAGIVDELLGQDDQ